MFQPDLRAIPFGVAAAISASLAVLASRRRGLPMAPAFTVMMAGTVYVTFDLDYPRFGFIRLDFADQALLDLLAGMK